MKFRLEFRLLIPCFQLVFRLFFSFSFSFPELSANWRVESEQEKGSFGEPSCWSKLAREKWRLSSTRAEAVSHQRHNDDQGGRSRLLATEILLGATRCASKRTHRNLATK